MEVIEILKNASKLVYESVKDLAGTSDAAGDFGRGAGGDISRKIDIVAEKTVLDYLKKINFQCVVLGEECGRVELSNPRYKALKTGKVIFTKFEFRIRKTRSFRISRFSNLDLISGIWEFCKINSEEPTS